MIKRILDGIGRSLKKMNAEQRNPVGFNCPTTGDPMYYDKYDCVYCGASGFQCKASDTDAES